MKLYLVKYDINLEAICIMFKTNKFLLPVADVGADKSRIGLMQGRIMAGRVTFMADGIRPLVLRNQRIEGEMRKTDLSRTIQKMADGLKKMINMAELPVAKVFSLSFPGAWNNDGTVYPGTLNNFVPDRDYKVPEQLASSLGAGWSVMINNDGVLQGLVLAGALLKNINRYPGFKDVFANYPRLAVFVPGSGFGAGGYSLEMKTGSIIPFKGPQQFYDIILKRGQGGIVSKTELTPEDRVAGLGIEFHANAGDFAQGPISQLGGRLFSGKMIAHIALNYRGEIQNEARRAFEIAGESLAQTMLLAKLGGITGKGMKTDVINPPAVETEFWDQVKGTRAFLLGGWLNSRAARELLLPVTQGVVKKSGIVFLSSDKLPGLQRLFEKDAIGLMGAAMQVPAETIINSLE